MDMAATRKRLIRKASINKVIRARVMPVIKKSTGRLLSASARRDLVEVLGIMQGLSKTAAPKELPVALDKMPGFSPMQLRQQVNRLAEVRQDIVLLQKQFEAAMKQIGDLEEEEKTGLDKLKTAAQEMGKKGKFVAEAEKALLEFTAYTQDKRPGIEQMIANPSDAKWGDKAGDLFGRIAAKLGDDIAKQVEEMYSQCAEDLTHTALAIKGLKVVGKTAGIHQAVVKSAGLSDVVVGIKTWLAGKADSIAQRILGFAGDVVKWVKGFVERTKLVGNASDELQKSLDEATKATDKFLAGA